MTFPISGVTVSPLVPFSVAYFVSLVMSTGGISGAFLLLPFQVSVLGFSGPAVTATNHLFNVVAIPSGVYRYVREKRMVWPLTAVIVAGTVPGVVVGSLARIYLLP
ncbi:MAG TPA: TSUP family transporter, partial [Vicinamibacteria bacterium]|nr:TSUP family transporter [Vicinamibacteria bacterium]